MTEEADPRTPVHSQALLLPWFLAGTLTEFEREAVIAHLSSCRGCQAELESVHACRELVCKALSPATTPSPEAERRVMQSIGSRQQAVAGATRGRRRAPWLRRVAGGVSVAVIGAQAVAILYLAGIRAHAPLPPTSVVSRGLAPARTQLRVMIAPTATEGAISGLLARLNARIVDGPRADGAYVIELAPLAVDRDASTLERLNSDRALVLEAHVVSP